MCFAKRSDNKLLVLYVAAVVIFVVSAFAAVLFGSTSLNISELIIDLFSGNRDTVDARIFIYARLPRALAALICGSALAVSGAVIQNVFSNPLASPSIIGVNSGAGLAVTVCTAVGAFGGWQIALFSFLGAFSSVMLITYGSRKWGTSKGTVILAGVALNSLLNAASSAITTIYPNVGVMSNDFKVGDFSAVTYQKLIPAAVIITVTMLLLFTLSNELDVIGLGEERARGLGMNVSIIRNLFLIIAALLAGAAVSIAGLLSFVGLIVPHIVRGLGAHSSRHLLPLSALFGGGFVAVCDLAARMIFSPYEIPVGIVMAFIGAPFFLFLLVKRNQGETHD